MSLKVRPITRFDALALPATLWAALVLGGCAPGPGTETAKEATTKSNPESGHSHAGHDHPSEGPHHGDLVELGNEEYHAEVVHGDAGLVAVYILDSTARTAVPIDATEVMINVTHDGKPEQFKLPAKPEAGEPEGKSSKFELTDAELVEHLDHEDASAKLVLTIAGKQYTGKIEHKHDHDHAHDHDHK